MRAVSYNNIARAKQISIKLQKKIISLDNGNNAVEGN